MRQYTYLSKNIFSKHKYLHAQAHVRVHTYKKINVHMHRLASVAVLRGGGG